MTGQQKAAAQPRAIGPVPAPPEQGSLDPNVDKCGCFGFRPVWLRHFATPRWFLITISLALLTQSFYVNGCLNVVLPTLERRFQLRSFESGTIISLYNVVNCLLIIPVAYLGSPRSKPVFVAVGVATMATGALTFSLPHFFAVPYSFGEETHDTCPSLNTTMECIESDVRNWRFVLILGHMLTGAGFVPLPTLGVAYMDENLPRRVSSTYVGIFTCMGILGATFGFAFAGYFLTRYEDLSDVSKLGLTPKSSVWVGAWWVGFLVAAVAAYIISIPLLAFPKKTLEYKSHEEKHTKRPEDEIPSMDYGKDVAHLPHAVKVLLKNHSFVLLSLASASEAMLVNAISAFLTKYYQSEFAMTPSNAALLIAVVAVPAGCGGTFLGGVVVTRLNLNTRSIMRMSWMIAIIPWFALWGFALHCPNPTFALNEGVDDVQAMFTLPCNAHCNCRGDILNPICSADNVVYFSPCFAGCTTQHVSGGATVYSNCSCIASAVQKTLSDNTPFMEQAARVKCRTDCKLLLPVTFAIFLGVMFTLFNTSPAITAAMRCVCEQERATALAVKGIAIRIIGSIPGPLILGAVIDNSCLVWQKTCGRSGSCIYYDNQRLANNMLYALLPMKTIAIILFYAAYRCYNEEDEGIPATQVPVKSPLPQNIQLEAKPEAEPGVKPTKMPEPLHGLKHGAQA